LDIPVRSIVEAAIVSGQSPNRVAHRRLLRTGMSARREHFGAGVFVDSVFIAAGWEA
jgi:hypothetical protein